MCEAVGGELSEHLRDLSIDIYERAVAHALNRGILIADTKFEFGRTGDDVLLIDEVLTPDSSRFWPADDYAAGRGQKSFDKQFVRDWLETTDWDQESDPPRLPDDIVANTRTKYIEAFTRLAERPFDWD